MGPTCPLSESAARPLQALLPCCLSHHLLPLPSLLVPAPAWKMGPCVPHRLHSCNSCCNGSSFWYDRLANACGEMPCWEHGTLCLAGTTCNSCCHGSYFSNSAFNTVCGKADPDSSPSVANPGFVQRIDCGDDGGTCTCGKAEDGTMLTLGRFYGDKTDMKVNGCGGAFAVSGGSVGVEVDKNGPRLTGTITFDQTSTTFKGGWEQCCYACGSNLEEVSLLESGWECRKDSFNTGIWLRGKNVDCWGRDTRCVCIACHEKCCDGYSWRWNWFGDHCD